MYKARIVIADVEGVREFGCLHVQAGIFARLDRADFRDPLPDIACQGHGRICPSPLADDQCLFVLHIFTFLF